MSTAKLRLLINRMYTLVVRSDFHHLGSDLDPRVEVKHPQFMSIGKGVYIRPYVWLYAVLGHYGHQNIYLPSLKIEDGCSLGRFCHIVCANQVVLERHVLLAEGVFISDNNHGYKNTGIPIMHQPLDVSGPVIIGAGTWIGNGARIIGQVKIGKNCVIGTNTVVSNMNIPDYSIVVGNPSRIVKQYDSNLLTWKRMEGMHL